MPPRANTSVAGPILSFSPRACSGAMYAQVPLTTPVPVRSSGVPLPGESTVDSPAAQSAAGVVDPSGDSWLVSAAVRAMPQSITCTSPNAPIITFCGLRSRCSSGGRRSCA